jgi:hypothetical protein
MIERIDSFFGKMIPRSNANHTALVTIVIIQFVLLFIGVWRTPLIRVKEVPVPVPVKRAIVRLHTSYNDVVATLGPPESLMYTPSSDNSSSTLTLTYGDTEIYFETDKKDDPNQPEYLFVCAWKNLDKLQ